MKRTSHRSLLFLFSLVILSCCPLTSRAQGRKWAILVGINKYANPDVSTLTFAEQDVKAVAKRLSALGYDDDHLFTMTGDLAPTDPNYPSSTNVIQRLTGLAGQIDPGDTLLFYFSGHGYQRGAGKNYLATIDANPKKRLLTGKMRDLAHHSGRDYEDDQSPTGHFHSRCLP